MYRVTAYIFFLFSVFVFHSRNSQSCSWQHICFSKAKILLVNSFIWHCLHTFLTLSSPTANPFLTKHSPSKMHEGNVIKRSQPRKNWLHLNVQWSLLDKVKVQNRLCMFFCYAVHMLETGIWYIIIIIDHSVGARKMKGIFSHVFVWSGVWALWPPCIPIWGISKKFPSNLIIIIHRCLL